MFRQQMLPNLKRTGYQNFHSRGAGIIMAIGEAGVHIADIIAATMEGRAITQEPVMSATEGGFIVKLFATLIFRMDG